MREPAVDPGLRKAFQRAYLVGLVLCVVWPLMLQLMLGTVIRAGANPPAGVFQQLGYTFTGLTFLSAAFVTWRSGQIRKGLRDLAPEARSRVVFREVLIYSALFELSSVYGLFYWMLVGQQAHAHARSFLMLSSVMFFFFVPRLGAWQAAIDGESA